MILNCWNCKFCVKCGYNLSQAAADPESLLVVDATTAEVDGTVTKENMKEPKDLEIEDYLKMIEE